MSSQEASAAFAQKLLGSAAAVAECDAVIEEQEEHIKRLRESEARLIDCGKAWNQEREELREEVKNLKRLVARLKHEESELGEEN